MNCSCYRENKTKKHCLALVYKYIFSWLMLQVVQNILDTERAHVSELQVSSHLQSTLPLIHSLFIDILIPKRETSESGFLSFKQMVLSSYKLH